MKYHIITKASWTIMWSDLTQLTIEMDLNEFLETKKKQISQCDIVSGRPSLYMWTKIKNKTTLKTIP